jgi:guanylate kinase
MGEPLKKGRLFVVSGPSGVGKSSIIEKFMKTDEGSLFSVSYTTRQKRPHEVEGKDYYFVDGPLFQEMVDNDRFLEWEDVHAHRYGTPRKEVADALARGLDMILDIDVKGALKVQEKCPQACLVFIEPPTKEDLVKRLSLRGEKDLELRMKRVEEELASKRFFQYTIVNDTLDRAGKAFRDIVDTTRRQ